MKEKKKLLSKQERKELEKQIKYAIIKVRNPINKAEGDSPFQTLGKIENENIELKLKRGWIAGTRTGTSELTKCTWCYIKIEINIKNKPSKKAKVRDMQVDLHKDKEQLINKSIDDILEEIYMEIIKRQQ